MKNKAAWVSSALVAAGIFLPRSARAQDAVIPWNDPSLVYSKPSSESLSRGLPSWSVGTDSSGNNFAINNLSILAAPAQAAVQVFGGDVAITFQGTGIQINGATGPAFGTAAWSIDGGPTNFVDACNSGDARPATLIDVAGLPNEPHVLKFEATSSACSDGNNLGFYNAVIRNGTPLSLQQGTVAGYTSSQWIKTGNWQCAAMSDNSDIGGGHCWVNNGKLSWPFVGNLIEVYGRPDQEDGEYTVTIDGRNMGTFSAQWGAADDDALNSYLLFAAKLLDGPHTITICTKNDVNSRVFTQLDMLAAFSGGAAVTAGGHPLPVGTWNFVDGNGNLLDFGFDQVGVYSYNNGPHQQPTYSSTGTICNTVSGGTNLCLSEQDGLLTQGVGADLFLIQSVSGGYVIQDLMTGTWLQGGGEPGARLPLSNIQYVWTANPVLSNADAASVGGNLPAAGTFYIADQNANVIDFGFYQAANNVSVYPENKNPYQQVSLSSANTLCNTVDGGTGACLSDQNGVLVQGSTADTFTVMLAPGGVTIRDNQTGRYLVGGQQPNEGDPPSISTSATNLYVWRMIAAL